MSCTTMEIMSEGIENGKTGFSLTWCKSEPPGET